MSEKMTLQEYIESRNYKRRLSTKSKSRPKLPEKLLSKNLDPLTNSSIIREVSPSSEKQKCSYTPKMEDLAKQVKEIDKQVESFSFIHKKVEQVKQFAREYVHDDKVFVTLCRRLEELESVYRLELIEAYRFQLFKYQFDSEKKLDEERKKMIQQLNDLYMKSKFEYKKQILKEKFELTKSQKLVLQQVIQEKSNAGTSIKDVAGKEANFDSLGEIQTSLTQTSLGKRPTSFFQTLIMEGSNKETNKENNKVKNDNIKGPYSLSQKEQSNLKNKNLVSESKEKNSRASIQKIQPKSLKEDQIQIKINSKNFPNEPSSKKVFFVEQNPVKQDENEYFVPNFGVKKSSFKSNPEQLIMEMEMDQSDLAVSSNDQLSSSESKIELKVLALSDKNSSKQEKYKYLQIRSAGQLPKGENSTKVRNSGQNIKERKTAKEIIEEWQRRKLFKTKDYLRVNRK